MLYRLFMQLLFLSLAGGCAAFLLLIICKTMQGAFSFRVRYYLWLLPLLLFLLPIAFSLPTQTPSPAPAPIPDTSSVTVQPEGVLPGGTLLSTGGQTNSAITDGPAAQPEKPIEVVPVQRAAEPHVLPDWKDVLPLVWLAGVLLLSVKYGTAQVRFRRFRRRVTADAMDWETILLKELCAAHGLRRPVALRRFEGGGSPFLSGVIHPVVYLPKTVLSPAELHLVLSHELIHCKRRDLLVKRLACAVKVIHWFNPLAWLAEAELARLCELSCDEIVTTGWDMEERRSYGLTILAMMRGPARHIPGSACLAEREIKHRLEVIMKMRKSSLSRRILSAALVVAVCLGCTALASGVNGSNPAKPQTLYQTDEFYYFTYLSLRPAANDDGDLYRRENYSADSGFTYEAGGSAVLTDTPLHKAFSATIHTGYTLPNDLNLTTADLLPASTFEVEMTSLNGVIESRGIWTGAFTVKRDGVIIFEQEPGRLAHVPSLDGTQLTELTIGRDGESYLYVMLNFGLDGLASMDGYAAAHRSVRTLIEHPDTQEISTKQSQNAVLDGYTAEPYFYNDIYLNNSLKQAAMELTLMPEDVYTTRMGKAPSAYLSLELRPQDVTYYSSDTVKGRFYLAMPDGQDLEFEGTITGLDGAPGNSITLRSDSGEYQISFSILTDRRGAELNPSPPRSYEGYSDSQRAELIFHDTAEKSDHYDVDSAELPFAVTLTRDAVTLRYTGAPGYRTGATLHYTVLTDQGWRYKTIEQLVSENPVTIPIPPDNFDIISLDLYQVSVESGVEMNRYTYYFMQGDQRTIAYDALYYSFQNSHYKGDEAIAYLTGQIGSGYMVPSFLFAAS